MLKLFILLGLIGIVFVAGSLFAIQANAQYQGQGSGGQGFQGPVNPVSGVYSNTIYGVQMKIPDGWAGFEMNNTSGSTTVRIAPGGLTIGPGIARAPITISMSMIPINASNPAPQFPPTRVQQGITCNNSPFSTNTVNGMNLNMTIVSCSGTNANGDTVATKAKYEMIQTSSAYIILSYRTNPDSGFDSQVATFDTMAGTLQIGNALQAPVVPEFPVPVIGLVVVIMIGSVILLGRTKIFPNNI